MPQENELSRVTQQQTMRLWLGSCILSGAVGLLAVFLLAVNLYQSHNKPMLDVSPERINPNTASMASLVRLPGIGRARAIDIIYYRQTHGGDETLFQSPQDLEQIHGIGPKTAATLAPWLVFNAKDAKEASDANGNK